MSNADIKQLKQSGFMNQVQKDRFSLRLRISGGNLDADKLKKVYEIAKTYGQGYIHITSRQGIDVPLIKIEDIEVIKKELEEVGLQRAAIGPVVRNITACKGSAICVHGLIDTSGLADEFDLKYYAKELPHKFKMGITGCPNNCLKAETNDLGVKGGMKPTWIESKCTYCGVCGVGCPAKAIVVNMNEKSLSYDEEKCISCGKCVKSCKSFAWDGKKGFIVYLGGNFGKKITIGRQLVPILFTKEEVHKVVETTLEFYKQHGKPRERFSTALDRMGWDLLEKVLQKAVGGV